MTKTLATAEVLRSGRTARTWNREITQVELESEKNRLCLSFSLSSKGGGVTEVQVRIGPEDFAAMTSMLASVDRGRATSAMAATLASELSKQSHYDRELVRKGRNSVVEAAKRAYDEAPAGHDHAERLTRDVVDQLVDELNEAEDNEANESSDISPVAARSRQ